MIGALCTGGAVFAKSRIETIEVVYDNIKVYKDNVLCELKDSNGSIIEPFIYNGTTYMPVRGTANLADMEVTWDGGTKSVYLWDEVPNPDGSYLIDECPPYQTDGYSQYSSSNAESFKMGGVSYTNGFSLRGNSNLSSPGYALFNLNSKYSTIEMVIGHIDGEKMNDQTVYIYLDGNLEYEIDVPAEGLPKTISLDVKNALQMKVLAGSGWQTPIGSGSVTVQ